MRKIMTCFLIAIALVAVPIVYSRAQQVQPQQAETGRWMDGTATNSFGTRTYRLWVPKNYDLNKQTSKKTPLLLMLHGCSQNPDDFAAGTKMNALADVHTFLVAYPDQPSSANSSKCWNWFLPEHQARDAGEPSLLALIVKQVHDQYNGGNGPSYALGMSAGAAMSVVMAATYPDLFSGISVSAGLEYKAGTNLPSAVIAQRFGGPDTNQQGRLAYEAAGSLHRRIPVIVFHGSLDQTVVKTNGDQVISQWAQTNDLVDDGEDNNSVDDIAETTTPGMVPNGRSYTVTSYNDGAGKVLMEKWIVENMTHAYSGGSRDGSFTDPTGPSASRESCRFFGLCSPAAEEGTPTATTEGGSPTPTSAPRVTGTAATMTPTNTHPAPPTASTQSTAEPGKHKIYLPLVQR